MKKILLIIGCVFALASLHAAEDEPKPLKKVTFLLSLLSEDYFFQELFVGLDQLAEEGLINDSVRINYHHDAQQLRQQFDAALNQSDAILMDYQDSSQVAYFIEQAKQRGIPLVFLFTKPTVQQLASNPNVFYVTLDEVQSGVSQGLLFSRYLAKHPEVDKNGDGTVDVLNISGSGYDAPDELERFLWQINTINNYPGNRFKIKEIENYPAHYGYQPAYDKIIDMHRQGTLDNIEAIIAQNEEMSQGAVAALEKVGNTTLPVFARGGSPAAKKLIKEGKLAGTVQSLPRQVTYYAGKIAYNYTNHLAINDGIPFQVYKSSLELPYEIITANDL